MWALNFEYKSDQTDFTDWIAFWLADLMEKINPNQQTFCDNTENLPSALTTWMYKYNLGIDALILPHIVIHFAQHASVEYNSK